MSSIFVSYFFVPKRGEGDWGFGSCQIKDVPPVQNIEDANDLAERIRIQQKFQKCTILNWRRFEQPEQPTNSGGGK